jgi:outer membrane receptor for ferrienterochelin and colicin
MVKKALTFFALSLLPVAALAQAETTGKVSGTVKDEAGNPVAGASVKVVSSALQGERETTTGPTGEFLMALLPVGAYSLTVSAPNLQPVEVSFRLGVGQKVPLEVVLKRGPEVTESVTVLGTTSKLETTVLGENFNYSTQVEELPIQNRAIEAVATYAPNISFGPSANTLSIAGAPSFDTTVLLDGSEVSDPYFGSAPELFLEDAVEEVQVLTSGVPARYGRFQGGVINAITKSGGNTFDGTVRAEFTNEVWNAPTPLDEHRENDLNEVYQATVGGYVLRDRLWFFAGGRTIPTASATTLTQFTQQPFVTTGEEDRWQLKLKGAITPNHVIEASHLEFDATTREEDGFQGAAGDLFAATGLREDPRDTTTLTYQGVLTPNLFVDFEATKKNVSIKEGATNTANSPFLYLNPFQVFHNHWWDFNDPSVRDNETLGLNVTQVLSGGDWGDHHLEYGAQFVNSTTGGENRQSTTGFNLLDYVLGGPAFVEDVGGELRFNLSSFFTTGNQLAYRWEALPLGGEQELKNLALYAQDSWQIDHWRIDAGVRWESYDGSGPLPTFDVKFDGVVPRLGVTYDVNPAWQVQATYGRYVSRFNDNVASTVTGVGSAPRIETIYTGPDIVQGTYDDIEAALRNDANWQFVNGVVDPNQPTTFLANDLEAPYADDMNVAVKWALPRHTGTGTLTYTHRTYENLLDDFVGGVGITTVTDPEGSGTQFDFDTAIWDNAPQAKRKYDAITATWDYRPGVAFNVGGNYTYAFTKGNYEGEGVNTPSSGSVIGNYVNSRSDQFAVPYGYLNGDIRHRVRAWGNYRLSFERAGVLSFGGVFTYQSGLPWSKLGAVPFADDPTYLQDATSSYSYYPEGRGTERFNGWWRLDMSARYQFPLVKDLNGWVKVDVLNVTNNDELISFDTSGTIENGNFLPSSTFGSATDADYQLPRSFLLTLGLQF